MFTYITTNHYSPKSLIIYKQVDITQYDSTSIQRIPNAFKVQQITNSSHPALNQFGLFAKRGIPPRTHILNYIGHVHTEEESQPDSNYDIRFIFTPQGSLHIDASKMGNEARFINDYRGIYKRPNCEFKEWVDWKSGTPVLQLGVFSLSCAIKKGDELCVTYGKGFWAFRS